MNWAPNFDNTILTSVAAKLDHSITKIYNSNQEENFIAESGLINRTFDTFQEALEWCNKMENIA